jgi:hypothetical protein
MWNNSKIPLVLVMMLLVVNAAFVYISQNTFDSGDSILHYLMAKQSWSYPKYFLHHWAKPFFVLVSSPFTQLGWAGMKLFNMLCVVGSLFVVWRIQSHSARVLLIFLVIGLSMPDLLLVQSSGLTEPLFGLILCLGLMAYARNKIKLAALIWSWLPFVRSEGWIILLVLAVLLGIQRKWYAIFFLSLGTIVYSLVGAAFYQDLLWVFHENPYQGEEIKYGSGSWLHYWNQLPYAMGLPNFIVLIVGSLHLLNLFARRRIGIKEPSVLALVVFWAFFTAHSIFWGMGWFHSFGLRRVFIAVLPLVVLINFKLLNTLVASRLKHIKFVALCLILLIGVFPYLGNPMGIDVEESIAKKNDQIVADKAAKWLLQSEYSERPVAIGFHYLVIPLERDMDNGREVKLIDSYTKNALIPGTILLWDSYFSESDKGVQEIMLLTDSKCKLIRSIQADSSDESFRISIFEYMP